MTARPTAGRVTSSTTRARRHLHGPTRARRSGRRSRPTPATSSSSTRSSRAAPRAQQTERDETEESTSRAARCRADPRRRGLPRRGVVAETLNMEALEGYSTGGTMHIIANNQIGFTTEPHDRRSTRYASDLAKGFDMPIVHVNADDPEACISAVRWRWHTAQSSRRGVVIDLIGYRRLGHNEADEPAYTQPHMYEQDQEPRPRAQDLRRPADRRRGRCPPRSPPDDGGRQSSGSQRRTRTSSTQRGRADRRAGSSTGRRARSPRRPIRSTGCSTLNREVFGPPEGFTVHRKLGPQREKRAQVGADDLVDWGQAEALAFATLLVQGHPLRLTGQDTARGHLQPAPPGAARREDGRAYAPIQTRAGKASFEITTARCQRPGRWGSNTATACRSRDARDVGGAVRRLRERRPGDRRSVHRVRPGEVGRDSRRRCCCRTGTKGRALSTRAPGRSGS